MKQLAIALLLVCACSKSEKPAPATKPDAEPAKPEPPPTGPYTLSVTPDKAAATEMVKLTLELKASDGRRVKDLKIVHEKPLHLIIVSDDLADFAHIHPEPQPDGTLVVDHAFPNPTTYHLFADFTPEGDVQSVARATVTAPGDLSQRPLQPEKALPAAKTKDGYEVTVSADKLAAGDAVLSFVVKRDGKVVTDLQPYLGARGHCVIISKGTEHYLHSHPLSDTTEDVQFHTVIPGPGIYKVWAEFRPNGDPLLVDFVIDVKDGAAPVADPDDHSGHDHGTPEPKPEPKPTGDLAAAEAAAWAKAKPVFEEFCSECHTKDGAKPSARKLAKLDIGAYPFTGTKSSPADMRKVLGIGGGKVTMPKGDVGAVKGDDLAAIAAWADAYDAAHP